MWRDWFEQMAFPPMSPFIEHLQRVLDSGGTIARADYQRMDGIGVFVLVLQVNGALVENQIPDLGEVADWLVEAGVRMATQEAEELRLAKSLERTLAPHLRQLGLRQFTNVFFDQLRALGPPRAVAALPQGPVARDAGWMQVARELKLIDTFALVAHRLVSKLKMTVDEGADILDGALERTVVSLARGLKEEQLERVFR